MQEQPDAIEVSLHRSPEEAEKSYGLALFTRHKAAQAGFDAPPLLEQRGGPQPELFPLEMAMDVAKFLTGAGVVFVRHWIKGQAARKVRLKYGDVEAEASTPKELEAVLNLVRQKSSKGKRGTRADG